MGTIRVLPDHLANRIAAGEVVERPVSALKELLENSLDAGATEIKVDVQAGGKRRIRVEDNGCGMDRDDCLMAFERHATSKLNRTEDLFSIRTLGFRGEALPSIASVAQVTLESAKPGSPAGVRVVLHGNKIVKVNDIARTEGTTLTVDRLFFNIPARKKFMRKTETELAHMVNLVTQLSLAHVDKRFYLEHQGRKIIDVTPVGSLRERIYQHYGKSMLEHLLEIEHETEWLRVRGLVSKPDFFKSTRNFQFAFVNQRLVKDRLLSHAVSQAYRGFGDGRGFPVVFLFVQVPSTEVDVNVHPAKSEVKFIHPNFVHDEVASCIRQVLVARPLTMSYRFHATGHTFPSPKPDPRTLPRAHHAGTVLPRDAVERINPDSGGVSSPSEFAETPTHVVGAVPDSGMAHDGQLSLTRSDAMRVPRVIGQFRESYILADDGHHLLLIDQHVAHERIRYDRVKKALNARQVERQALLLPATIELTPDQWVEVESLARELSSFGFEVEPFDEHCVIVRAVPAVLAQEDPVELILNLIEKIRGKRSESTSEAILDSIAATRACKGAVKINMPLTLDKMQHLVDDLWRSQSPLFCPHGRPIVLTFSNDEIERNFHRK